MTKEEAVRIFECYLGCGRAGDEECMEHESCKTCKWDYEGSNFHDALEFAIGYMK